MKCCFFVILVLLFTSFPALATPNSEAEEKAIAKLIAQAILERHFTEASHLAGTVSISSPLQSLSRMAIQTVFMFENLAFNLDGEFLRQSEFHQNACRPLDEEKSHTEWTLMLCGAGDSLRALHQLKNNTMFRAIGSAEKALDRFQRVKIINPKNFDVDLGIGLFEYFRSQFTQQKLKFLPFVSDNRVPALEKIMQAAEKSEFMRDYAKAGIALIATESGRTDLGDTLFPKLKSEFPKSLVFRIMEAAYLIKVKRFNVAITELKDLLKHYPELHVAKYLMGRALALEQKNPNAALAILRDYLKTNPDKSVAGPTHYFMALAHETLGDLDAAIVELKLAREINPRYKATAQKLREIQQRLP